MPRWEPKQSRPIHETVIDLLLTNPGATNKELAQHLGYSEQWVMMLRNSDAFRHRFAERRAEVLDPLVKQQAEEQMDFVTKRSLAKLNAALDGPQGMATALGVLKVTAKASAFGARGRAEGPIGPISNLSSEARESPERGW